MSRRASLLLRASVLWTVWVWIVLVRNVVTGNFAWTFKAEHITLAIVSLAFAVVTWQITSKSRRFTREVERERRPQTDRMSASQLALGAVRLGLKKGSGARARAATAAAGRADARPGEQVSMPAPVPADPTE